MKDWSQFFLESEGFKSEIYDYSNGDLVIQINLTEEIWVSTLITQKEDSLFVQVWSSVKEQKKQIEPQINEKLIKSLNSLITIWKKYITTNSTIKSIFVRGDIEQDFLSEGIGTLEKEEFNQPSTEQLELHKWLYNSNHNYAYFYTTTNSLFNHFEKMLYLIMDSLNFYIKKIPNLHIDWNISKGLLKIENNSITISKNNKNIIFTINNHIFIINNEKDIHNVILDLIEISSKEQKIESNDFLIFCKEILFLEEEEINHFYNFIKKVLKEEQLQTYARERLNNQHLSKSDFIYKNKIKVIRFHNHYIVFSTSNLSEFHLFEKEKINEVKKLFKDLIFREQTKSIDDFFEDLL